MDPRTGRARPPLTPDGVRAEPPLIDAWVSSGGSCTRYIQAGSGPPVVLLHPTTSERQTIPLCFTELSRQFRVVAPVLDGGGLDHLVRESRPPLAFSTWLQGFLDGLGLARVSLVAGEAFGVPVLHHALLEPDRVERVALMFRDVHARTSPEDAAGHTFTMTETSVMIVPCGGDSDGLSASATRLIPFLAGAWGPLQPEDLSR